MNNVIPFNYQGQAVRFNSDGWINATEIAKHHGKRLDVWLKTAETQAYLDSLGRHLNTTNRCELIQTERGRKGGTWLHPKMAVVFARWLDVDFGVWCDLHIDALLRGEMNEKQQFDRACRLYSDAKGVASVSGRQLAKWRITKPTLEHQVEYWRDQLQLTLGLDAA